MPRSADANVAATRRVPGTWIQWGVPLALTALAYFATGLASLLIGIPPSYAAPLYPAAGVALASVLVYGPRMLAGIAIGAFALGLALDTSRGLQGLAGIALPLTVAFASALQAGFAAVLLRRFARQPLTLTQPGDVAAFLAACTASSIVVTSIATLALGAAGVFAPALSLAVWATWWIGDFGGLVIVTPIVLTLIGRPRAEWAPRRLSVGLTMTLVVAFLCLGIVLGGRWNNERLRASFTHDASSASLVLATQLDEPLRALEALHGIYNVNRHLSGSELRRATAHWLGSSNVSAMGWAERVKREDVAAFEARARAEGAAGYRVFDRADGGSAGAAGGDTGAASLLDSNDVIAIRHIEPLRSNAAALGVNSLSVAPARLAILQAIDTGEPAASAGFRLTQSAADEKRTGVVIYQAIYDGEPANAVSRRTALRGMAFVTVAMDAQLAGLAGKVPDYLRLCVVEVEQHTAPRRLSGAPGCESEAGRLAHDRSLIFAGRQWDLRVSADPEDIPNAVRRSAWILTAVGLLSAAMLGV